MKGLKWNETNVAMVHEYLVKQGGSEQVVMALHQLCPNIPIFSSVYSPGTMPEEWMDFRIHTSFLQSWAQLSGVLRDDYHQRMKVLLPWMPLAYEAFDLSEFDIVVSSCHAFAKGILTGSQTLHVSYIHSPTRYLWEMTETYVQQSGVKGVNWLLTQWLLHRLRQWDFIAAQRPDLLIANSRYIQQRITKFYRRQSTVIYPPVDVDFFEPVSHPSLDFYLVASRLVPYKRVDLAIEAFNQMKKRLVVVGEGPELPRLKKIAGATIEFLPYQPKSVLKQLFGNCRAFVFPWAEDFGITPVEVQACGRPVIALKAGGAQETIVHGKSGILFDGQIPAAICAAVHDCDNRDWDPDVIRAQAEQFSYRRFWQDMDRFLQGAWEQFGSKGFIDDERRTQVDPPDC